MLDLPRFAPGRMCYKGIWMSLWRWQSICTVIVDQHSYPGPWTISVKWAFELLTIM